MRKTSSKKRNNKALPAWIGDYSRAVRQFTLGHDPESHLPFDAFRFYPLYFEAWLDKIYEAIDRVEKKSVRIAEIAEKMPPLGSLRFLVYSFVNMSAFLDYDSGKARKILDFFVRVMGKKSREKDIFQEERIITRNRGEISEIFRNCRKVRSRNEAESISRLVGVLAICSHAFYNDYSSEYGYAVDGPYELAGKNILLVREFPDLSPKELWPEMKKIRLRNIRVDAIYGSVDLKMRFVSNHILATERLAERLVAYRVSVNDKKEDDLDKIGRMMLRLAEMVGKMYLEQKELGFEKIKKKFLEQQGYELKGLFYLAGMPWRPNKDIIGKVKGKKLVRQGIIYRNFPKTRKEYEDYIGVGYLKKIYKSESRKDV